MNTYWRNKILIDIDWKKLDHILLKKYWLKKNSTCNIDVLLIEKKFEGKLLIHYWLIQNFGYCPRLLHVGGVLTEGYWSHGFTIFIHQPNIYRQILSAIQTIAFIDRPLVSHWGKYQPNFLLIIDYKIKYHYTHLLCWFQGNS